MIQLTLTLKMTNAQVVETSVTVNKNSPIQDYVHPDDQTQPTFEMTPGFKPFTVLWGSGRGGPDPASPPLFRENPASRTFFISFSNFAFLSQKNTLKSLISTKANKCKMIILWQLVTNIISWVLWWLGRKQVALSYTCLEEESLLHVWSLFGVVLTNRELSDGFALPFPYSWQFLLTQWRFLDALRGWRGLCVHRRLAEHWIFLYESARFWR